MRSRPTLVLLVGLGAGFALGWIGRGAEEPTAPAGAESREAAASGSARPAIPVQGAPGAGPRLVPDAALPPPGPDSPELLGQGGPASFREDGWARAALLRHYHKRSGGNAMPQEDLAYFIAVLERQAREGDLQTAFEYSADGYARGAWDRERLRLAEGTLEESPVALFQSAGVSLELSLAPDPTRGLPEGRHKEPLDFRPPAVRPEDRGWYLRAGIVPRGKAFVIETVDIRVCSEERGDASHNAVSLRLPGTQGLELPHVGRNQTLRFACQSRVAQGEEDQVSVRFDSGRATVEVRLSGRLLGAGDRASGGSTDPRLTAYAGDGYLTGGPILLQLRGGDGELALDGGKPRRAGLESSGDLWDENVASEGEREAAWHVEGVGHLPPGKALEITRVTYRALLPRGGSIQLRRLDVQRPTKEDQQAEATEERGKGRRRYDGTWTGAFRVRDRDLRDALLRLHRGGLAEARIEGTLVDEDVR